MRRNKMHKKKSEKHRERRLKKLNLALNDKAQNETSPRTTFYERVGTVEDPLAVRNLIMQELKRVGVAPVNLFPEHAAGRLSGIEMDELYMALCEQQGLELSQRTLVILFNSLLQPARLKRNGITREVIFV